MNRKFRRDPRFRRTAGRRRVKAALAVTVFTLGTAGGIMAGATPASATAETCISTRTGIVCTKVWGSGTYVEKVRTSKNNWQNLTLICDYSAWFFYVPPSGGAYGLGYQQRRGCTFSPAWLVQPVNRSFPRNTLICGKWFENNGQFVSEKCVGVS